MFTKSEIKKIVLKSWFHHELLYAELQTILNNGVKIIHDERVEFIRKNGEDFLIQCEKENCTKEHIQKLQKKFKFFKNYYNQINKSIDYIIKKNQEIDLKNNWIPMYLFLAIAKRSKQYGVQFFTNDNLDEMIKAFTETNEIDKKLKLIYWKLARKILEDLEKL